MRIAVISDIHGNIPALQAVLQDIDHRNVSRILCLGDLIGTGPNSSEAIDICVGKCHGIIAGNWDKFISNTDKSDEGIDHLKNQLGSDRLEFLRNLPEFVEFYLSGKLVRLFHAHPLDVFKRIHSTSDFSERVNMFVEPVLKGNKKHLGLSDIVGYGDIHWAFMQNVRGKILFNAGSVGNPLDLPMASYVVLEGDYESKMQGAFTTQFYRVPYDIELAIKQAEEMGVPQLDIYKMELRTARYSRR